MPWAPLLSRKDAHKVGLKARRDACVYTCSRLRERAGAAANAPASGRRKGRCKPDPTELSEEEQLAHLDDLVLRAQKQEKRAQATLERAEKYEDAVATKAGALIDNLEAKQGKDDSKKEERRLKQTKAAFKMWTAATEWVHAAETDLLEAKLHRCGTRTSTA